MGLLRSDRNRICVCLTSGTVRALRRQSRRHAVIVRKMQQNSGTAADSAQNQFTQVEVISKETSVRNVFHTPLGTTRVFRTSYTFLKISEERMRGL